MVEGRGSRLCDDQSVAQLPVRQEGEHHQHGENDGGHLRDVVVEQHGLFPSMGLECGVEAVGGDEQEEAFEYHGGDGDL